MQSEMPQSNMIPVSPRHSVVVDEDYLALIQRAPQQDFVMRTLARRMAGTTPLMVGELVIGGVATREAFELARTYPLHFRKTYYTGRLRCDPQREFDCHTLASRLVGVPAPIGHALGTFRSCLLPGKPYSQISPFGAEPEESNIKIAAELSLPTAAGLWRLAEELYGILRKLQEGDMTHGDAELHNFVVCPTPLEVMPIDFEQAVIRSEVSADEWEARCLRDFRPILREAIYLQCALGEQRGEFAHHALSSIDALFRAGSQFRRAMDRRSNSTR